MDLSTVNFKLNDGQYLYVEDMIDDIQLIWDNCKTYNSQGSVYYLLMEIVDLQPGGEVGEELQEKSQKLPI